MISGLTRGMDGKSLAFSLDEPAVFNIQNKLTRRSLEAR
jgi:hypothetical protein